MYHEQLPTQLAERTCRAIGRHVLSADHVFGAVFGCLWRGDRHGAFRRRDVFELLMAGIIVQTVAFGSTMTAIAVCNDLQKGNIDRFHSMPMSNLAVLNGHVISDVFRNGISTVVMLLAGLVIGFRTRSVMDWLMIAGILLLFTLAFSWLSAIMEVIAKSVEGVQRLSFVIVFPLTFASSAFVTTEGMNSELRAFAENQPITQIVESVRVLILGTPVGNHGWLAVAWSIGIMAVAIPIALYLFKKKSN